MTKSNSGVYAVLILLICTLLLAIIPTEAEAMIYEDTIRLHILAPSDSDEDQELKLAVRDMLLRKYGAALYGESLDEARENIEKSLADIERDTEYFMHEAGYAYTAKAALGREYYERRVYEDITLPEGYYTSLIITLGQGEGRNWWCVMYPPMCLDIACETLPSNGYSESEQRLITRGGKTLKFKILEGISSILK